MGPRPNLDRFIKRPRLKNRDPWKQSLEPRSTDLEALENGARGRRFDASYKRHPVTESSYINRLANRPYRSTIKTLPATLPEPWTMGRGPRSSTKVRGPRTLSRGSWTASRGSSFTARALWTPDRGYWGWLLDFENLEELNATSILCTTQKH